MKGYLPELAIVGVGGAGVNAAVRLRDLAPEGLRFLAVDTSAQTLARAEGMLRLLLESGTGGHGSGGDAARAAAAAQAASEMLDEALAGVDLAFVVAGLAGGTGGGAAPEIARRLRAKGAVALGLGIQPFAFETGRREELAAQALEQLEAACHTTVALDNCRAQALAGGRLSFEVALRLADDILRQAVQGLSEMLGGQGWINVDWPTLRPLLLGGRGARLALGLGRGGAPAQAAMRAALASPLADMEALGRASAVLVQVTGDARLAVRDTAEAVALLRTRLAPDCSLVVGAAQDPRLSGAAEVVLLGTGLDAAGRGAQAPVKGSAEPAAAGRERGRPAPLPLATPWWPAAAPLREVV